MRDARGQAPLRAGTAPLMRAHHVLQRDLCVAQHTHTHRSRAVRTCCFAREVRAAWCCVPPAPATLPTSARR
jgi:hypothetical protein